MAEHNLPDKDDAPWLNTTLDGFNEELALKNLGIQYGDFDGENDVDYEAPNGDYIKSYPLVTRVEVVTNNGREFVKYECSNVQICEQDEGQTLKVFLFSTYD